METTGVGLTPGGGGETSLTGGDEAVLLTGVEVYVEEERTGAGAGHGAGAEATTWGEAGSEIGEVTWGAGGVGSETGVEISSDFVEEAGFGGGAKASVLVSV